MIYSIKRATVLLFNDRVFDATKTTPKIPANRITIQEIHLTVLMMISNIEDSMDDPRKDQRTTVQVLIPLTMTIVDLITVDADINVM